MAKDKSNPENAANGATEAPAATAKKEPKPGELKTLFAEYEKSNVKVEAASAAYDKAMADRSKIVEQFAQFGAAFKHPTTGERLTVSKRANKTTGVTSFYFKGPGKAEALKIE